MRSAPIAGQTELVLPVVVNGMHILNRMHHRHMQALGFHVWVAELELLVGQARGAAGGSSKQPSVDPVAAVELLQKLQATIESAGPGVLRQYQRRCEEALADVLLRGTAPPVGFLRETEMVLPHA